MFASGGGVGSLPASAADRCPTPAGRIVSIQGVVEIGRAEIGDWRPARLDDPLCPGESIRVGDRSRAEAVLADQPKFRIDQNTTLRLIRAQENENEPSLLDLLIGEAYFFSHRPTRMRIATPFLNAAIEGTEFLIKVDGARTVVTVLEGAVVAANERGRAEIERDQAATAETGTAPVRVLVARPRDAVQWALYYPPLPTTDDDPPALRRAATLLEVGRVDEARAEIDAALARDPGTALAYALRAVVGVAQNERAQARADAEQAVQIDPNAAAGWIALSYAEQARFALPAARDAAERAVAVEPGDALAWARVAELRLALGERVRARAAAERARQLAPDSDLVETVSGFVALTEMRTAEARSAFERAIALDSANPMPRFGLGLARIREGAVAAGRNEIEIAVGLDPDNALLRSYLGKAHFEDRIVDPADYLGLVASRFTDPRPTTAEKQFAIAKELDPNDPTPLFYDALLKQAENRPVAALADLEKSIALNDKRAVHRSRQMLDADRAARGASLARIYNDLGFEQLGIVEAARSLALDPAGTSAHRLLSDLYAPLQRREMARTSELLQAQLLQDINVNPVQPSLSETQVNSFTRGGPFRLGLNEYSPLFERNQAQLNVSGQVGSNDTFASEAVVSGVYDWTSISAGWYRHRTDGWRHNSDIENDVYNVFAQAAVSPRFNMQAEISRRYSDEGWLFQQFDPNLVFNDFSRDFENRRQRLGLRYDPSPRSTLLASLIHADRHDNSSFQRSKDEGVQGELQHIYGGDGFSITSGAGRYHVDRSFRPATNFGRLDTALQHSGVDHTTGYVYTNVRWPEAALWTLGVGFDDYREEIEVAKAHPKLGVQWTVVDDVRLRLAAFRTIKPANVATQTLQPTQVAGFNQFFDDIDGTESWSYGAGVDVGLGPRLDVGAEVVRRDLKVPVNVRFIGDGFLVAREDHEETIGRAYLYWAPASEWAFSAELVYDLYDGNPRFDAGAPNELTTWSLPVGVRFFHPTGLFAGFQTTFVHQNLKRDTFSFDPSGDNSFAVVDLAVGYRLPERRGLVSLEVSNLFDENFKYQDDSFRGFTRNEPFVGRYIPDRQIVGRLTLNF
jgi:tetratricopeptide (TPR) repeat protein